MTAALDALDVLRKATEDLLHSRGVFDIDAFGWGNEDDVGYAMWTLSPPYPHDFEADDTPPDGAPTKAEQQLMEFGHDFFGLMKTARHFIGYALLHQPTVRPLRVGATEFDFSEFAALAALIAATERLRNFIIVTIFGAMKEKKLWKQFEEACDKLRDSSLRTEADTLQKGFDSIKETVRKARNEAVHGLATRPAHVQKELMDMYREAFEQRWHVVRNEPYEEMIREQKRLDAKELADVEARAKLLCDCYVGLVKIGEVSFRSEYEWRQGCYQCYQ
jgi:hypothetical protein